MIRFDNWTLQADGDILARQFDNLTRTLTVSGDIPAGWEWAMLVQVNNFMDIIPLTAAEGALSVVLTAQQLSISGPYQMQLRATQGDRVRHTNTITVYIPASLSGDTNWPDIPSEFTELERRVNEKAAQAEGYSTHPPIIGENGNWWEWDGEAYADTGKPSQGDTGPAGKDGKDGINGKDGGYYTPSFYPISDTTMEVAFSPSDPDTMPELGVQHISLPSGYTPVRGVDYYTPEDMEAIVADATARVEASFGGTYELVEEITTTEELTRITRTALLDGTAYRLKAAKVKMVIAAGAGTGNVNVQYQNTEGKEWVQLGLSSVGAIATGTRYHWSRLWRDHGAWECEFIGGATSKYSTSTYKMAGYDEAINDLNITRIDVTSTTSGIPIPAGTNIKIYGVRA